MATNTDHITHAHTSAYMHMSIQGRIQDFGMGVLNCAIEFKFDHTHLNPAHFFHLKCATFNNFVYDL